MPITALTSTTADTPITRRLCGPKSSATRRQLTSVTIVAGESSVNARTFACANGVVDVADDYLLALVIATRGSRFGLPGSCSESRNATMALSR
jgi:hypothetical protein